MNASSASTDKPVIVRVWNCALSSLGKVQQAWVLVVLFLSAVSVVTYMTSRIYATYSVQREQALLRLDNRTHAAEVASFQRSCEERLDVIEQTLFGVVLPKQAAAAAVAVPRLSQIEIYQQNANKELRTRLDRLERWRLAMER